ncbi:MAG TPA: hypothetical protein VHF25_14090 [Nitriliruptorales bacterium]|nr:hypothetical protein [Nitriliruptorales bacterium]
MAVGASDDEPTASIRLVQRLSSPQKAGRRVAFLASSPEIDGVTGRYFERRAPVRLTRRELDQVTQERANLDKGHARGKIVITV